MDETIPPPPVTFETLCERHGELLNLQADEALSQQPIAAFLNDASAAGAQIESVASRDAVRSMINYWSATLSRQACAEKSAGAAAEDGASAGTAGEAPHRPALAAFDPGQSPTLSEADNPFVGLAAFDEEKTKLFFGRASATTELLQLVLAKPLVVVSGASGTGKSSLVRAGLLARLAETENGADWLVASAYPGFDPLGNLVAAFDSHTNDGTWREAVLATLEDDPKKLAPIVEQRAAGRPVLVLIDQFEEMFSLCAPAERDRAAEALAALAGIANVHLLLTIREEYLERERYDRALPALDLARAEEFRVPPLTAAELKEAVTAPASRAGLVFQEGVVERIVADVSGEPAALPLLQFALLQLWRRREGNRVTLKTYEEVGGPTTALSRAAEKAYARFQSSEARTNVKLVFQQLVRPSLVYEAVRDRVTRAQLEKLLPGASVRAALEPFVAAALIRITPGSERGEDRIEIAHESLIRNWDQLRSWAFEVRDREQSYLSLQSKAEDWQKSGRAPGHLLFGRALSEAEATRKAHSGRARSDLEKDGLIDSYLAESSRRAGWIRKGLWSAATLAVVILATLVWVGLLNRGLAGDIGGLKRSLTQATATDSNSDTPRQFVQMLLSQGAIRPEQLPDEYADMLASAQPLHFKQGAFDSDFLGIGVDVTPHFLARRGEARSGPPPVPGPMIALPNLRIWPDRQSGLPILAISQLRRGEQQLALAVPNRLWRMPGVAPQLDEREIARRGLGLGRLVDWREVSWGPHGENAAGSTNVLPALFPVKLRRPGYSGLSAWTALNNWLLLRHNPAADRVLFLSGVVPARQGDPRLSPPRALWKAAVSVGDGGRLEIDAAMLPSRKPASVDEPPGKTSLEEIGKIAGIDFSKLIAAGGAPAEGAAPPAADGARVYIQTREIDAAVTSAVTKALTAAGYSVMPPEEVEACVARPLLRYYYPDDADAAKRAAAVAATPLRAAGIVDPDPKVEQFGSGRRGKARQGHLELWICGGLGPLTGAKAL
jgi:hypothetical protein